MGKVRRVLQDRYKIFFPQNFIVASSTGLYERRFNLVFQAFRCLFTSSGTGFDINAGNMGGGAVIVFDMSLPTPND